MGAVWMAARSVVRRRLRSLVVLGLLGALVGATVLGAAVGARRTTTAYDRLVATTSLWDLEVALATDDSFDAIRSLPAVRSAWAGELDIGQVLDADQVLYLGVTTGPPLDPAAGHYRPQLVEGRLFDPEASDEVIVSELTARFLGWEVGHSVDFAGLSPEQYAALEEGEVPDAPAGSRVRLTVTGIIRDPYDALPFELPRILASPGYHEVHAPRTGGVALLSAGLVDGADGLAEVRAEVEAIAGPDAIRSVRSHHELRAAADRATDVAARGLVALAVAAAAVGLVALGQAIHRTLLLQREDLDVLRSLGLDRRGRLAAMAAPFAPTVVVATTGGVAGAALGSRWTPVGVSRAIEPDPGVELNVALLGFGGLAIALVTSGLVVLASLTTLRRRSGSEVVTRPSPLVGAAAASGAPVPWVIGTGFAVDPGRGRSALPTRSALVGVVLGVVGLTAAITVVTSLEQLFASPDRFGWSHDFTVANAEPELVDALVADPDVRAVAQVHQGEVELAGGDVQSLFVEPRKGRLSETILEGRMPVGAGEVAIGPSLARRLDVGIGDDVAVAAPEGPPTSLRIVGLALTESPGDFAGRAVFDAAALAEVAIGSDVTEAHVALGPDADHRALIEDLAATEEITLPEHPTELLNLVQTRSLIRLLAVFLGVVAAAAVAHVLAVTTRRRRRDLAVLRALGLTGRQLGHSVVAMATVLVATGLTVGVPLGVLLASVTWRAMTAAIHLPADLAVPAPALAVVVAAAAVVTAVLSLGPAHRAANLPADALRTE